MKNLPNLLIVDDSEENLAFLESVTRKTDINLIQALSGPEALEKTRGVELALAIIDVRMPGMNGYELAMKMNEERSQHKAPIIFLTASHVDEMQVFEGYGFGAVDYIFKPIDHRILLCKINVFLDLFDQKQTILLNAAELKNSSDELIRVNVALIKSEEKYRSYIDHAPDGVFVADELGKYIEVNDAACRITGYTKEELLSMTFSDLLPDDSQVEGMIHFRKVVESGYSKADLLFRHRSGIVRWWAVEAVKLSETRFLGFTKDITRRVEMEESLRVSQIELELQNDELSGALKRVEVVSEKYVELYDFAPSGYYTLSEDKTIKDLNHSGARILGKERSRLINKHFNHYLSVQTRPVFDAFFNKVLKGKTNEICEVLIEAPEMQPKFVHIEGVVAGNGSQFLINVVDITERKKTENALHQTSTRLALATRAGGVGVWDFDIVSNRLEWDDHMFALYGADKKKFNHLYTFWVAWIHPDDRKKCDDEIQLAILGDKEFDTEFRICWPDGSVHNIRALAVLVRDESGNALRIIGTNWDITTQKKLEENLKSSEANFRTFFETLNDMIVVGNSEGEVIYINKAVSRKLGYPETELLQMHIPDLHPAEMRAEAIGIFTDMLSGKCNTCPLPLARKDGSFMPVETRVWEGKWDGNDCIFGLSKDLSAEQEALQKFNKVFDNNPSLMAISSVPQLQFTDVNKTFLNKTGYSREELIGKTALEMDLFLQPEKQDTASRELQETGYIRNFELQIKTKEGKILDGLFSGEIIESQGEKFLLTVMTDITERKQAEEELRHANSLLDSIVENIPNMIFLKEAGLLRFVQFNRAGEELLGISREEIIGMNDYDLFSGAQADSFTEKDRVVLRNREMVDIPEEPIQTKHQGIRILHTKKVPVMNAQGEPDYLLGISEDITERKMAEQAMIVSEEKYKTMLNASPDGILLINMKGIITEVSEIGVEIFGADTRDDLVGKNIYRFIPSTEKSTLRDIIEKTISEGLAQNIGLNIQKKNRSVFASETSATLIQSPDGTPISFMIIIRDISHRKKMETKQIHADRMANLGEMASGIAHEINQPLNIISMVMDKILFESAKTETIDLEFLKTKSNRIFENITRIRNIIDHIRAFSRSHDDFVLTAFDINSSIENAASMIMEQFKHLGINLNLQLEKQIPQIFGNTYKFEQVIVNLLVNAKDAVIDKQFKREDYQEMNVDIRSYQENQFIVVEVTDNGIGIGNDDINKVMLPFYTTKDEGKGTGLGLSICYQIIKEMNGTVEIISDREAGTKIKLVLDIQRKK